MIDNIDIEKILISNKGFKYFIGCKDDEKVQPFNIMLPKMSGYTKGFNGTKYISFWWKMMKCYKNKKNLEYRQQ